MFLLPIRFGIYRLFHGHISGANRFQRVLVAFVVYHQLVLIFPVFKTIRLEPVYEIYAITLRIHNITSVQRVFYE